MKDYSAMSDFEINKAVAILVRPEIRGWDCHDISGRACFVINSNTSKRVQFGFSFTSDPADAWPIIVENEIAIISSWNEEGVWGATVAPWNSCEHTNPLRAAMIVFLQLNDPEKCDG